MDPGKTVICAHLKCNSSSHWPDNGTPSVYELSCGRGLVQFCPNCGARRFSSDIFNLKWTPWSSPVALVKSLSEKLACIEGVIDDARLDSEDHDDSDMDIPSAPPHRNEDDQSPRDEGYPGWRFKGTGWDNEGDDDLPKGFP